MAAASFDLFLLEAIPLMILIGVTAATIGYTAWAIVVPLLFVGFGFPAYDTLFASIAADLVNSAILTVIYSRQGKVNMKQGLKFGSIALGGAVVGVLIGLFIIPNNQSMLRGGVAYMFFVIGAFFLYRGYNMRKKVGIEIPVEKDQEEIQKKGPLTPRAQIGILIAGAILVGLMAGFTGMGGGSTVTLIFLFVLGAKQGFDTLTSTGTGCFVMLLLSGFLTIVFGFLAEDITIMLPYLVVILACSSLGTILGARFALKAPEWKLNFLIGIAINIAAILGTIQFLLFV